MGAFRSAGVGLSWIESLFHPSNLHFDLLLGMGGRRVCRHRTARDGQREPLESQPPVPAPSAARNPLQASEAQMKRILFALVLLASVAGCEVTREPGNLGGQEGTPGRQRPGWRCGRATGCGTKAKARASMPR